MPPSINLGVSAFKHKQNNSAKLMYNNFGRPETLLWLLESLGKEKEVLLDIVEEIKDIKHCQKACSEFRKKVPFERILELIEMHNF